MVNQTLQATAATIQKMIMAIRERSKNAARDRPPRVRQNQVQMARKTVKLSPQTVKQTE